MKKIVFIIIIIILFLLALSYGLISSDIIDIKQDKKWVKVSKGLYFDKSSIVKGKYSTSGWFKYYETPEYELLYKYKSTDKKARYETIKYNVFCDSYDLFILHYRAYDKNDNLLIDEADNHNVGAPCSSYVDGEIICNAICNSQNE